METLDVLTLQKQSANFYYENALSLIRKGLFDDALRALDTAIVFSHNTPFYILEKIRLLYYHGDPDSCSQFIISQLNHLYKVGNLYTLCRSLNYLQQIEHYDLETFQLLLDQCRVPYCLANCYPLILRRRFSMIYKLAKKAMVQDHHELCIAYCKLFIKSPSIIVHYPDVYYLLAYSYHLLGQLLDARKYYQCYYELQPYDADAYMNLGLISMELGDYKGAIPYIKKACLVSPSHYDYQLYLGECYYLSKKYKEAIATYETLKKEHPNYLQVYFNLSHIYKKINKSRLSNQNLKLVSKLLSNTTE